MWVPFMWGWGQGTNVFNLKEPKWFCLITNNFVISAEFLYFTAFPGLISEPKAKRSFFPHRKSCTSIAYHPWGSSFMTQQTVGREESALHADNEFSEDILWLIIFYDCTINLLGSSSCYNTFFTTLPNLTNKRKHWYFANYNEISFYIKSTWIIW